VVGGDKVMAKGRVQLLVPAVVTGVLIILIAVVFRSILHKSIDVVPLYLVPIFFYVGYLTGKSLKIWIAITLVITVALAIFYALS